AVIISVMMIVSLAACGNNTADPTPAGTSAADNTNSTPSSTAAATDAANPASTTAGEPEATTAAGLSDAEKDAFYDQLVRGETPLQPYGANYVLEMVGEGMSMISLDAENGDTLMSLFLSETVGYNAFKIGTESYLEAYMPGENGAVQHVLYKSSTPASGETEDEAPITAEDISDMTADKEAIVSVKYLETLTVTKENYGLSVKCDAVEVVIRETVEADEFGEETTAAGAGAEPEPQYADVPAIYYFDTVSHKTVGCKINAEGAQMEVYFPDALAITLPQMEVTPATDEEISAVIMAILLSAMAEIGG
ncbi:MAG: hypothetical protein J6V01_07090, partial [Clostridia bacterium]|nr:hypothetical protein [Clostridia bacterium]